MSYKKVKEYFEKNNIENRIIVHENSADTVEHAALTLGCDEKQIAKTMSFLINDQPILIVMAGDAKIDNYKYRTYFGVKAKMIAFEDVENIVGHAPGGVCPFAINDNIKVYLDISLKRFDVVYAAAGDEKSTIGLSIPELEKYSNYTKWIDVCKNWENIC